MNASSPEDPVGSPAAIEPAIVARLVARDHAASLATVARQRVWLLEALSRGADTAELARDLSVTPRAIRHLLGDVGRPAL